VPQIIDLGPLLRQPSAIDAPSSIAASHHLNPHSLHLAAPAAPLALAKRRTWLILHPLPHTMIAGALPSVWTALLRFFS
jgi:hypothetical protein